MLFGDMTLVYIFPYELRSRVGLVFPDTVAQLLVALRKQM